MAQPTRRPAGSAAPRLEALETRWMPAVTIGGFVHEDCNANGIFESDRIGTRVNGTANEGEIAGSTIRLLTSDNVEIGQTVTDASGYYQFTVDPNIVTDPVEVTYDATFAEGMTDLDRVASLRQFDSSLGELLSVEIRAQGTITSRARMENLDPVGADLKVELTGSISYDLAGLPTIRANVSQTIEESVGAYDNEPDMDGDSGHDFGDVRLSGNFTPTRFTDAGTLSAFRGTGSVAVRQTVDLDACTCGSGNLLSMVRSVAEGRASVVYRYRPANSGQSRQYIVEQVTQPGGFNDGLDTSTNTSAIPGSDRTDRITVTVTSNNQSLQSNHFGEMRQGSLSGFVYHDVNRNGTRDAGDAAIPGTQIRLSGNDAFGRPVDATTTTDGAGLYSFAGLTRGTYTITETQPATFQQGTNNLGTLGGSINGDSFTVSINCGENGTQYNFGEVRANDSPDTPSDPSTGEDPFERFSKFFLIG